MLRRAVLRRTPREKSCCSEPRFCSGVWRASRVSVLGLNPHIYYFLAERNVLSLRYSVPAEKNILRFLLNEIGITGWAPQKPEGFADLYQKCMNLDKADQAQAKHVLE